MFVLQMKLIWGLYHPSIVSHVTGATTTSGKGLRDDGGVSVLVRIFNALYHTFILFCFTIFPSAVSITTALSDTLVTVVSFHDLLLASPFIWYITESATDSGEALAFTANLVLNCPAMDAFLSANISLVSSLGCTSEMLVKWS